MKTARSLVLGAALAASITLSAGAQISNPGASAPSARAEDTPRPPVPGKQDKPPLVMMYLVLAGLVAMVVGANLIPSKRGHQD